MQPPAQSVVVGATVVKRFPGYGNYRGTIAEINGGKAIVHWSTTDERTTLTLKEAAKRVVASPLVDEDDDDETAPYDHSGDPFLDGDETVDYEGDGGRGGSEDGERSSRRTPRARRRRRRPSSGACLGASASDGGRRATRTRTARRATPVTLTPRSRPPTPSTRPSAARASKAAARQTRSSTGSWCPASERRRSAAATSPPPRRRRAPAAARDLIRLYITPHHPKIQIRRTSSPRRRAPTPAPTRSPARCSPCIPERSRRRPPFDRCAAPRTTRRRTRRLTRPTAS